MSDACGLNRVPGIQRVYEYFVISVDTRSIKYIAYRTVLQMNALLSIAANRGGIYLIFEAFHDRVIAADFIDPR